MSRSAWSLRGRHRDDTAVLVPALLEPRWPGHLSRLDVWYLTVTDPDQQLAAWIHHEVAVPRHGPAQLLGWTALYRRGQPPLLERFGPVGRTAACPGPSTADVGFSDRRVHGSAGRLAWDLLLAPPADGSSTAATGSQAAAPLFTFPRWAWDRQLLPGAQVLPIPATGVRGTVRVDGHEVGLSGSSTAAVARIFGHGSPERWGWLHADLGNRQVLEVVSAVGRRGGLDRLPPLAFVQLRWNGRDWPRNPLTAALRFRSRLGLPDWSVLGCSAGLRLRVAVHVPADQAVTVAYRDPDGASATCTNSGLADADIVLERRDSRWETVASWELRGTAHAEIGTRP
jgi:hypothetical protein